MGSTPGLGYAPLVPAKAYLETDANGAINKIVGVAATGQPIAITTATYYNTTGVLDITTEGDHRFESGIVQEVKLHRLEFSCATAHAGVTTTFFPEEPVGLGSTHLSYPILRTTPGDYVHKFASAVTNGVNTNLTPNGATYSPTSGVLTLTFASAHGIANGSNVTIANNAITFTCDRDNHSTTHSYPRASDPASGQNLPITLISATSFSVNVGKSATYRFTTNVGTSTIPHTYVGGGDVMPWYGNASFGSGYRPDTVSIGITDVAYNHKFVGSSGTSLYVTTFAGVAKTATEASYEPYSGDLTLTIPSHGLSD